MDEASKVVLVGFEIDPAEKAIANNVIKNYVHKIGEREEFEQIKLRLKQSRKAKTFLHQVEGELKIKTKIFTSKAEGYNLFSVLDEVLGKLLNELVHSKRTSRQ